MLLYFFSPHSSYRWRKMRFIMWILWIMKWRRLRLQLTGSAHNYICIALGVLHTHTLSLGNAIYHILRNHVSILRTMIKSTILGAWTCAEHAQARLDWTWFANMRMQFARFHKITSTGLIWKLCKTRQKSNEVHCNENKGEFLFRSLHTCVVS